MVVGDVMLDEFHWCHVTRISPEAPVPVCRVDRTDLIPGGAANVSHNLVALGAKSPLFGVVGADSSGEKFIKCLQKDSIPFSHILKDPNRSTTLKSRVVAANQQVARVDREDTFPISEAMRAQMAYQLSIFKDSVHAIVISDYLKGTLTPDVVSSFISFANQRQIPVVVDPKGNDYQKYSGATVLTPNFSEFQTVVRRSLDTEEAIYEAAIALIAELNLQGLVITRSEKGATVIDSVGHRVDVPTRAKEVFDVTGAGDTVTAVLALALSVGCNLVEATQLANVAAGVVVGKLGTATLTYQELLDAASL